MIIIDINDLMMKEAMGFAKRKRPTSFPRLNETKEQQLERLYVGKLGELVGQEAMKTAGIPHECPGKLEVVDQMGYRDAADCVIYPGTENKKTVDFKTAWKPYHTRILIPTDMFIAQRKDLYIGTKVHLIQRVARVFGYQTRQYVSDTHTVEDFGEGPAYWVYLSELRSLDELKRHKQT
jgi:hypothetical protein